MALEFEKHVGVRGLNLGIDPAQVVQGSLVLADGVRFLEAGAAHSRNGRVRAGLEFPSEGSSIDNARILLYGSAVDLISPYIETIEHVTAAGRVRGFTPYYDQRLETRLVTQGPDIPQRLNFVYKSNAKFYLNEESQGDGGGIISGDGSFNNIESRAKFVVYRDRVFVADQGTAPKIFQRRPKAEQAALKRPTYDIRRIGIVWPTATAQAPTVLPVGLGGPVTPASMPNGTYRFRIILENKNGTQSNPSMPGTGVHLNPVDAHFVVSWAGIVATFPTGADAITKVRVYVQFTALGSGALEPSAYVFHKVVDWNYAGDGDGAQTVRYLAAEHFNLSVNSLMPLSQGAPPRLLDIAVSNDVMYGIAAVDEIFREVPTSEGERNLVATFWDRPGQHGFLNPGYGPGWVKLYNNTIIKAMPTTSQYVFCSNPGQPEYMESWYVVGTGSEICVGLVAAGNICIVFTNQGIYSLSHTTGELKRVHSKVGCLSRDSIVETEQGIRFLGSDGVPRIFNGATVDEISNELLPLFDREDYVGDYFRFDRTNAQECQGTFGDRKFYFTFPAVDNTPGYAKPGTYIDTTPQRQLAIGDASRGPTAWTIDRPGEASSGGYETVYWLGRESRLLGIEVDGAFYFIEEGFEDQLQVEFQDAFLPSFDMKFRKFASAAGLQGQFYRVAIDANTQGETLTVEFRVDDVPALVITATFSTERRDERKFYLPANFKGRYLDVRIFGTVATRVAVYGATIELAPRGVF